MPSPTRAAQAYLVDPFVPTRDTLPCEHCGTTLSNCDWFPDSLGRLSVRCPNAHRHGTGWKAFPEPKPFAVVELPTVMLPCTRCGDAIDWSGLGKTPDFCLPCRKDVDRERSKLFQRAKRARMRGEARVST